MNVIIRCDRIGRMIFLFILAFLLLPGSTDAAPTDLVFHFRFNKPEMTTKEGLTSVSMTGLPSWGEPGQPILPLKKVDILIPFGMMVKDIDAFGKRIQLPGEFVVEWGEIPVPIGQEPLEQAIPDPLIYQSDKDYPGTLAQSLSIEKFRGYHILLVHLYPVQYQPLPGKLSYLEEIDLHVHLQNALSQKVDPLYRALEKDRAELSRMVINPDEAQTYPSTPSSGPFSTSSPAETTTTYDHVIITPSNFQSTFQRLVDYKNSIGVASTIVTVEEIYNNPAYDGVDRAEEIRNFIRDAYQNWGISYVLLGGDDYDDSGKSLVPERGCHLMAGGDVRPNAACDLYFGALDGTWNDDGDDQWCEAGEIDYYPEVHVGRVTAETIEGINNWLDKDIFYEQNAGHPHQNQALWLGEKLDFLTWGSDSKESIRPLLPEEYVFTKLYDKLGNYTKSKCISELNKGPHLVNHLGHSNLGYVEKIYRSDVDNLSNDFYFFNYSQGCDAGAWDQDFSGNSESISEHFIFSKNGAFAVIMNSRYGWYTMGSSNGPSQKFDYEFFDAIFTEDIRNLGAANDDSKIDNAGLAQNNDYMRWCYLELNLHGDPQTAIHYLVPGQVTGLTFENNKKTMNWNEASQASQYDIVKGDLIALRSTQGDFTSSLTECLEDNSPDTQAHDSSDPFPGGGSYYLVRAQDGLNSGSYNTGSLSQIGDRDYEIDASPNSCP